MKDFISKVTFGFLMAQFLPGAVVVFSLTWALQDISKPSILFQQRIISIGEYWFSSTYLMIIFLFITVAIGMVIHGLNWTVLAWLENRYDSYRESFGHRWLFWIQIFVSPVKMLLELLWLLVAPSIDVLTMEENVGKINSKRMSQFLFLQEFYLHFGQFYAHMAYALLVTFICGISCCIYNYSLARLGMTVFVYFLTSLFFLLGRIQLGSLFKAERSLTNKIIDGKLTRQSTPTAAGQ